MGMNAIFYAPCRDIVITAVYGHSISAVNRYP